MKKLLTSITTILFFTALLTFPLGQILRLQLPGNVNASVFDMAVLFMGCFWLLRAAFSSDRPYQNYTLARPILLFFLMVLISLIANLFRYPGGDLLVAVLYALRWLLFACLYFVTRERSHEHKAVLPDFLTIIGGSVVVLGYVQYFLYPNLRNLYYLGWDEHIARMFSTFLDPNFAGAFFALFFLFVLGRMLAEKAQLNLRYILYSVLLVATFAAIFLSTSRSAVIMLTVGLFTYLFLIGKKKWMFGFIAVLIVILLLSSRFFYIENINPFRVTSSLARVSSAQNALAIISQNSIFGVGFNAYRYAQYEYGYRIPLTEYPNHADSGTDNSFLFVFATTGIVGFVAYLYLLASIYKVGKKQSSYLGAVLIASLVGLMVDSLFINSLFYPPLMFWLWVLAGITDYT